MEKNKEAIAKSKFIRISQRKMVGLCKLVRDKDVLVARSILMRTAKKGARLIEKTLDSAVANAKNKNMDWKNLFISKITADMGPAYKRYIPWSKGSARPIKKRTTHLTIVLKEREGIKKADKKAEKDVKEEAKAVEKKEVKAVKKEAKSTAKEAKPKVKIKTVKK